MKKLILAFTLCLPLFAAAGDHSKSDYMERMQKRLDLSEQQQTQIQQIFKNHHAEMEKLRDQTHQQVDAILNDKQRAEMAKMREQRREKWQSYKEGDGKHEKEGKKHSHKKSDGESVE